MAAGGTKAGESGKEDENPLCRADVEGFVLRAKRKEPSVTSGPGHASVHLFLRRGQVGCRKGLAQDLLPCTVAEQSLEKSEACRGCPRGYGQARDRASERVMNLL